MTKIRAAIESNKDIRALSFLASLCVAGVIKNFQLCIADEFIAGILILSPVLRRLSLGVLDLFMLYGKNFFESIHFPVIVKSEINRVIA